MKRVRRKRFEDLSARQKYTRLKIIRSERVTVPQSNHTYSLQDNCIDQLSTFDDSINTVEVAAFENSYSPESNSIPQASTSDSFTNLVEPSVLKHDFVSMSNSSNAIESSTIDEGANISEFDNFKNLLRKTFLDLNVNHIQINGILSALRTLKCLKKLPKDSRTLLKTNREKISAIPVGKNGFYRHIGLIKSLTPCLQQYNKLPRFLELELNTDGICLSRSDPRHFWPIQIRVLNIPRFKPLMVGLFKGESNPTDVDSFLKPLIKEVEKAKELGGILINNERIPFKFSRFIGDGPGEALVLNHAYPTAFHACSKCEVVGYKLNGTTVYPGIEHEKRTSQNYKLVMYKKHQKGKSPLYDLGIDPVEDVPFDKMHVADHGVPLKCEQAWFVGKYGPRAKLLPFCRKEMSDRHSLLNLTCPSDFARRPQPLLKMKRGKMYLTKLKATEWRHFVLYAAPVILFGVLSTQYYEHFLLLHVAMRILVSKNLQKERLDIAKRCLKTFVKFAPKLYSPRILSFVTHCLLHLVEDAKKFGSLDECSCYAYENNNNFLKRLIRNHPKPLEQFANRLQEKNFIQYKVHDKSPITENVLRKHENGPTPNNYDSNVNSQYEKYESDRFTISIDSKNNFCQLEDGSIGKVENILSINKNIFFYVSKFQEITNYYVKPVESSYVGVYKCCSLSKEPILVCSNNVTAKCYQMPSYAPTFRENGKRDIENNSYILSTLLHTEGI